MTSTSTTAADTTTKLYGGNDVQRHFDDITASFLNQRPTSAQVSSSPCLPGDQEGEEDAVSLNACSPLNSWLDLNPMDPLFATDTCLDLNAAKTRDASSTSSEELNVLPEWTAAIIASTLECKKQKTTKKDNDDDDDQVASSTSSTMISLDTNDCNRSNPSISHFDPSTACKKESTDSNASCRIMTNTTITTDGIIPILQNEGLPINEASSKRSPMASPPAFRDALFIPSTTDDNNNEISSVANLGLASLTYATGIQENINKDKSNTMESMLMKMPIQNHSYIHVNQSSSSTSTASGTTAFTPHTPPLLDVPMDTTAAATLPTSAMDEAFAAAATTQALFSALPGNINDPSAAMTAANAMALMASFPLLFSPQQLQTATSPILSMTNQQQQQQQQNVSSTNSGLHTPTGTGSPPAPSIMTMPCMANDTNGNGQNTTAPMATIPNAMLHSMNMSIPAVSYPSLSFPITASSINATTTTSAPSLASALSSSLLAPSVYSKMTTVPCIQRPMPARLQLNNNGTDKAMTVDSPLLTPTEDSYPVFNGSSTATSLLAQRTTNAANPRKRSRDDTDDMSALPPPPPPRPSPPMSLAMALHRQEVANAATTGASASSLSSSLPLIAPATLEHPTSSNQCLDDQKPRRQRPRFPGDLYTPSWVRYAGQAKEGCCEDCKPAKWLQLKNSAYWYHKQFYHGISSVSGRPFIAPVETRVRDRDMIEGLCHQCRNWVPVASHRRRNCVLWYRHAHKCHVYQRPRMATVGVVASTANTIPTGNTTGIVNYPLSSTTSHSNGTTMLPTMTSSAAQLLLPTGDNDDVANHHHHQQQQQQHHRNLSSSSMSSLILPSSMDITPAAAAALASTNTAVSSLQLY